MRVSRILLKSALEWVIIIILFAMMAQLVGNKVEYGSIAWVLLMFITARNFLIGMGN